MSTRRHAMPAPATLIALALLIGGAIACRAADAAPDLAPRESAPACERIGSLLAAGDVHTARTVADSTLATGPVTRELLGLAGEAHWLTGSPAVLAIVDSLRGRGAAVDAAILELKVDLMLGRPGADGRLAALAALAREHGESGDHPEARLVRWLSDLDRGQWERCQQTATSVADAIRSAWIPHAALLLHATDRGPAAVAVAESLLTARGMRHFGKLRRKLAGGAVWSGPCAVGGTWELPYADCGPQMGWRMRTAGGREITVSLDTGTGTGLLTIHSLAVGESLAGPEVLRLEDGIWYNYMPGPVDVVVKSVQFADPPLADRPVEYFDGGFSLADGCISPFALPGVAITVDPQAKRVWLRDRSDLAAYLQTVDPARSTSVAYVRRGGWIFVPATVDGHAVLLMVETGSREVNLNRLAAERLGLPLRDGTLRWRGKDHPVKRADVTVTVGDFVHHSPDALVDDFVLGNNWYGLACAGDLGPEFLRGFRFTIDPFAGQLVLEELAGDAAVPSAGTGS